MVDVLNYKKIAYNFIKNNWKSLSIGFCILIISGYSYYRLINQKQEDLYADFTDSVNAYHKVLSLRDAKQQDLEWPNLEAGFEKLVDQHLNSKLAPYFLSYYADVLAYQNKIDLACKQIDLAVEKLKNGSSDVQQGLYHMYFIKSALMKCDSETKEIKEVGLEQLKKSSEDTNNPFQDMALYYLGYQALSSGNKVQADKIFSDLVNTYKQSLWATKAAAKLEGL